MTKSRVWPWEWVAGVGWRARTLEEEVKELRGHVTGKIMDIETRNFEKDRIGRMRN